MTVDQAPKGIFYVRAYGMEKGAETCYSEYIKVGVDYDLASIDIIKIGS